VSEIVLDPSVAAKWYLTDEQYYAQAEQLRLRVEAGDHDVVLPFFWDYEVASIFSKAVANQRLGEEVAREAVQALLGLPAVVLVPPAPIQAFDDARRFNRTLIDCFYLSAAEERGCDFWTDDRKIVRTSAPPTPGVRWIGDYPIPAPASSDQPHE
jgi:predicted nucleic acid-binding protein